MEAPGSQPLSLGGPEPLTEDEGKMTLIGLMGWIVLVSGTMLFIGAGLTTTRTRGASRTAWLRQQERQQAAAQAVLDIEAERAAEAGREPGGE
jgi:hypothetical protein